MAAKPHVDDAPYVEQTTALNDLEASFSVNSDVDPPEAVWTCPVCHGDPQQNPIDTTYFVGLDLPPLDLICHCGHLHGDKQGCGFGATVKLPDSLLEGSDG